MPECKYWTEVAISYECLVRKERENWLDLQLFILSTSMCMHLIGVAVAL